MLKLIQISNSNYILKILDNEMKLLDISLKYMFCFSLPHSETNDLIDSVAK